LLNIFQNNLLHLKFLVLRILSDKEFHKFRCNICGKYSTSPLSEIKGRATPSCYHCGSTRRFRSIVAALSEELFGEILAIPDFPKSRSITGIGMSDSDIYAVPLSKKFSYINTYYHKEPGLDITSLNNQMINSSNFVISSDVFEHVPPPINKAFDNLFKVIKKDGVCIFSVPYIKNGTTKEHFPDLFEHNILEKTSGKVLVNKTKDGITQIFENLRFHGGGGATLEMRVFSESSLIDDITRAGFTDIKLHNENIPDYGIFVDDDQNSLVISFHKN